MGAITTSVLNVTNYCPGDIDATIVINGKNGVTSSYMPSGTTVYMPGTQQLNTAIPWYVSGYLQIGGPNTIYIWQNGDFGDIYWNTSAPTSGTGGTVLGPSVPYCNISFSPTASGAQTMAPTMTQTQNTGSTSVSTLTNQYSSDYIISMSGPGGPSVSNLTFGQTATANVSIPWWGSGYLTITNNNTGGVNTVIQLWQDTGAVFWNEWGAIPSSETDGTYLCPVGGSIELVLDGNFEPLVEQSGGTTSALMGLTNNYSATVTLTDAENSGVNLPVAAGTSASTGSINVPWYYSLQWNFSRHNIQITGGPTSNPTIYIWQNSTEIYWSYSSPSTYTDGNLLCGTCSNLVVTINSGFQPSALQINLSAGQNAANNFYAAVASVLGTIATSVQTGSGQAAGQLILSTCESLGMTSAQSAATAFAAEITIDTLNDLNALFSPIANFQLGSITAGFTAGAAEVVGGTGFIGFGFDVPATDTIYGVASGGTFVSSDPIPSIGAGFQIGFNNCDMVDAGGPGLSFGVSYADSAGVEIGVALNIPTDGTSNFTLQGFTFSVIAGEGWEANEVVDYTDVCAASLAAPASRAAAGD